MVTRAVLVMASAASTAAVKPWVSTKPSERPVERGSMRLRSRPLLLLARGAQATRGSYRPGRPGSTPGWAPSASPDRPPWAVARMPAHAIAGHGPRHAHAARLRRRERHRPHVGT